MNVTRSEVGMKQIGVLVIEDQPVMRQGLKLLLDSSGEVTVVGEVDSGDAAARALASRMADVVMLDLDLRDEDGFGVIPRIAEIAPSAKVLAFTASRDLQRHRAALLAGFRGVVTKDQPGETILKAIHKVAAGELWFERHLIERMLIRSISRANGLAPERDGLTARETEIILLISEGLKNADIAARLRIRRKTVCNHLTSIFSKLGVTDRLELLVRAQRLGLVSIPRRVPSMDS